MKKIHEVTKISDDKYIALVECAGCKKGNFYSESFLRVVEMTSEHYTNIRAKNVKKDLACFEYNTYSSRGANSQFYHAFRNAWRVYTNAVFNALYEHSK